MPLFLLKNSAKNIFRCFNTHMKVHPINQIYIENPLCKRENVSKSNVKINALKDSAVLNYMNALGNYNISFQAAKADFYAIKEDGTYKKYSDRKVAQEELSLAKSNIAECLQGKRTTTHGYGFIYASDIETTDKDGNPTVDIEKLNAKILEIQTSTQSKDTPIPIYAIDKTGKYQKFDSKYQAAKTLGVRTPALLRVLDKELKKTGNYTFVYPNEIETQEDDSEPTISREKLSEIIFHAFEESRETPIYAIDENGRYQRFSGIRKAARELNVESANISRCLSGNANRAGNYAFIRAEEVESKNQHNFTVIDTERIRKVNEATKIRDSFVPIYAIGINGKHKRFENKQRAADAIGMDISELNHCMQGRYNVAHGYSFALAEDVETIDENGKIHLNYDVLKDRYEEVSKTAVYAISQDGSYKKYATQTQAAEELGLSRTKITDCISGVSTRVHDKTFIKASDVETYENGNIFVNRTLIKRFADELSRPRTKALYSFDTKGKMRRHESTKQATEDLSISKTSIQEVLSGKRTTAKGYYFVYAESFETQGDNGKPVVDYESLDSIAQDINPQIRKRREKHGKIFALKDVNVYEFKDIGEAARVLGIDEEKIDKYLNFNINPDNKAENTIKGYTFTTWRDK